MYRKAFFTRDGLIKDYVKPIGIIARTGSVKLREMQAALENTLKMYSNLEATAENTKALWETLASIRNKVYNTLSESEKHYEAFIEMEEYLGKVGSEIAWGEKRKGVTRIIQNRYASRFIDMEPSEPEFINTYLTVLTCISTFNFSDDDALGLFNKIDRMSDEELLIQATKDQDKLRNEKVAYEFNHTPVYNFEKVI